MSDAGEIRCGRGFLYPGACSDMCGAPYYSDGDARIGHECCSTVAERYDQMQRRVATLERRLARVLRYGWQDHGRGAEGIERGGVWSRKHGADRRAAFLAASGAQEGEGRP